jgi:hypothetical protein
MGRPAAMKTERKTHSVAYYIFLTTIAWYMNKILIWSIGGMSLRGRNRMPCRKTFPSATMSPNSPTQNGQESKRNVRSEGTALDCSSHVSGYIITIRLLNVCCCSGIRDLALFSGQFVGVFPLVAGSAFYLRQVFLCVHLQARRQFLLEGLPWHWIL